jgi:hypothetical protein
VNSFDILLGYVSLIQHTSIGERFLKPIGYQYYFGIPSITNWKAGTGYADVYLDDTAIRSYLICLHVFLNFFFIG